MNLGWGKCSVGGPGKVIEIDESKYDANSFPLIFLSLSLNNSNIYLYLKGG